MGDVMKFDYDRVSDIVDNLNTILRNIDNILDDFDSQINRISNGSIWEGPAAEGFVSRSKKFSRVSRNYENSLRNIIVYIVNCSNNYNDMEDKIKKRIAEMMGR